MCVTLSLEDEEKRSTEIDNNTTDHQSDAMVSNVLFFYLIPSRLERRKWLKYLVGHTQDITVDDDPNFDPTAPVLEDESPYPEVRAAVANTDDPKMPSSTFRAWVLGLIWAVLIPGVNQVFFFRYPSVGIDQVCKTHFPWLF